MQSNSARNLLVGVLAVVIGVLLVAVGFLGRVVQEGDNEPASATPAVEATATPDDTASNQQDIDPALLDEIIGILQQDFVEPDRVDRQYLYEGAINGIFEALGDPHSTYIDPGTYAVSQDDFSGAFQGIGATVSKQDDWVVIVTTLPGTPAEAAGLQAGDIVLEVNGESAEGWSVEKAVLVIRGRTGTSVDLRVRHTNGEEEDLSIVRDEILVASVDQVPPGGILRDETGAEVSDLAYVRIRQFTSRTPDEMQEILQNLGDQRGLILDLRGNPGGLLIETMLTADEFLDQGVILVQVDRDGTEQVFSAREGTLTDLPVVVLQDEFSASGAELLSAALQENGRATVVGTPSFGKGTVNHARDLSNGGAVYVSIARWLTPNRNQIEGRGVIPDVEVTLTADDIEAGRDVALYRAIDTLRAEVNSQSLQQAS